MLYTPSPRGGSGEGVSIMSIKKENRMKKAAKRAAHEEAQARNIIRGIIIALIVLGVALVALLSM